MPAFIGPTSESEHGAGRRDDVPARLTGIVAQSNSGFVDALNIGKLEAQRLVLNARTGLSGATPVCPGAGFGRSGGKVVTDVVRQIACRRTTCVRLPTS